ncbi:PAS domain-containing protein [bacterium]|nr:PAS domain-containing protein [bacterium]
MKLALRWKITIAVTLGSAAILAVLYAYLHAAVRVVETRQLTESLLTQAHLAADQLPPLTPHATGLQAWSQALDARIGARVTIIAADGVVLADSREEPGAMENHADRPERLQALAYGHGSSIRFSHTLRMDMLYVAIPVGTPEAAAGPVLRLARPLVEVYAAQAGLQRALLATLAAALAAIWLLGLLLARHLTAPVEHLVRVARRVSKGDLTARAERLAEPELAELGTVLNSALDELARLLQSSQRESRYYAAILQQMSDAVVIVDRTGRAQFVNAAFARLFRTDEAAAEGRSSEQLALNYDLSALLKRAVEQGAVLHDEVRVLYPEPRSLAAVVTPLHDDQGQTLGAVGLLHDVTDLRRLDEVRREFVANASHELRTPAAGVKALAEALQMGALRDPERGPRFVGQIVEAADRLTSILDDMLVLTRVERGQQLLKPEPVAVAPAVAEVVEELRLRAEEKGLALETRVGAEDIVRADPHGLHTVLLNLADNALKYTPRGGLVTITGRAAPEGYELAVSDTGVGIPPEHQGRIFERFYRVDKARDRATGGTGLGLSIVRHIMESHGGRVTVHSVPGEGSTFSVFFPAAAGDGDAATK